MLRNVCRIFIFLKVCRICSGTVLDITDIAYMRVWLVQLMHIHNVDARRTHARPGAYKLTTDPDTHLVLFLAVYHAISTPTFTLLT